MDFNDYSYESQGYSLFEDLEDFNIDDIAERYKFENDEIAERNKVEKDDFAVEDEVVYQHHPEGSPKPDQDDPLVQGLHPEGSPMPDQDNPLVQGLVRKLRARFDEDQNMMNTTRRFWYKRVTGMSFKSILLCY